MTEQLNIICRARIKCWNMFDYTKIPEMILGDAHQRGVFASITVLTNSFDPRNQPHNVFLASIEEGHI